MHSETYSWPCFCMLHSLCQSPISNANLLVNMQCFQFVWKLGSAQATLLLRSVTEEWVWSDRCGIGNSGNRHCVMPSVLRPQVSLHGYGMLLLGLIHLHGWGVPLFDGSLCKGDQSGNRFWCFPTSNRHCKCSAQLIWKCWSVWLFDHGSWAHWI